MVKRHRTLVLAAAAAALLALVYAMGGGDDQPAAVPRASGRERSPSAAAGAENALPRVGLDRVRPASARPPAGRDIFDFGVDPRAAAAAAAAAANPPPPVAPTPTPVPTPTPLPALNVKYIGSVERKGLKVAVFMTDKKEIVSGQAGETVMNRFRVVRIGYESVDVQQVGADQVQRLPLKGN